VTLTELGDAEEIEFVKNMIFRHAEYTGSREAEEIILNWDDFVPRIVRVIPNDYRRVLDAQLKLRDIGLSVAEAAMAAFELNSREESRRGN
jgi:glutamate synthase domain-containing protein 3